MTFTGRCRHGVEGFCGGCRSAEYGKARREARRSVPASQARPWAKANMGRLLIVGSAPVSDERFQTIKATYEELATQAGAA